ncbi:hypothetical protein MA20_44530 [Bradyrhizobium japonicum]|uniref:Uncharacterized protein n=1 Tax=Bradyrhizobium japonicum TaxID=375 RepID=A0A0A3XJS7_BRAJP|nr:hypothetical protein MA20_44530 [Bradyrhizobium japonicum]
MDTAIAANREYNVGAGFSAPQTSRFARSENLLDIPDKHDGEPAISVVFGAVDSALPAEDSRRDAARLI